MSVHGPFSEPALRLQEWQICVVLKNVGRNTRDDPIVSATIHCVVQDCFFSHPTTHLETVGNPPRQCPGLPLFGFPCEKISCMVLELPHMPVSVSRNGVHKDCTFFGLMCAIRNHSETFRRTSPTQPILRESGRHGVRCLILEFWMQCVFRMLRPRCSDLSTSSSLCSGVPPTCRSAHPLRRSHWTSWGEQ